MFYGRRTKVLYKLCGATEKVLKVAAQLGLPSPGGKGGCMERENVKYFCHFSSNFDHVSERYIVIQQIYLDGLVSHRSR